MSSPRLCCCDCVDVGFAVVCRLCVVNQGSWPSLHGLASPLHLVFACAVSDREVYLRRGRTLNSILMLKFNIDVVVDVVRVWWCMVGLRVPGGTLCHNAVRHKARGELQTSVSRLYDPAAGGSAPASAVACSRLERCFAVWGRCVQHVSCRCVCLCVDPSRIVWLRVHRCCM